MAIPLQRNPAGGWVAREADITTLMKQTIRQHMALRDLDASLNIETHLFDVVLNADSCAYDLDVGREVWLNIGRWSRLIREYVPLEGLNRFVSQAQEIMNGGARDGATANLLFNELPPEAEDIVAAEMQFRDPKRYAKKHRWGGCLMGATFRQNKDKTFTLTFLSRTTYIGYMGLLDAGIANRIAACITNDVSRIKFRWVLSSMQLHAFKTLPYIYSQPDMMAKLEAAEKDRKKIQIMPPTWKAVCQWFFKVVDCNEAHGAGMLELEKYGPLRRIKRRWLEHKGLVAKQPPPSLPITSLGFEKAE